MAHLSVKSEYLALQKRLDQNPIGAPGNEQLYAILEILFTPEECKIAAAMPMKLSSAGKIAACAKMESKQVEQMLSVMARKGQVVDFPHPNGKTYYYLNPTVIGFLEFSMIRKRTEIDQKKMAELIWAYFKEDPDLAFLRMLSEGPTFLARPLVHEDALETDIFSEVLDWEKASEIIDRAGSYSMGICHCRHVKLHLGKECVHPLEFCLGLGKGAEYLIHNGMARRLDKIETMDVLVQSRESGLVQMCDNVKQSPTFICNCCKCCCEMLDGLRTLPQPSHVVSSNYIARVDETLCNGCGKCAKACPVDVIDFVPAEPNDRVNKRKKRAVINENLCLGCGVCHRECEFDSITLMPMEKRVYTPDSMMEKMMMQAIERGKLQHMLFDDMTKVSHRTLSTFLGALLRLPPAKQLLAGQQLRSKFVKFMVDGFKKTKGGWMAQ